MNGKTGPPRDQWQIIKNADGTCDVWLTPTPGKPPVFLCAGVPDEPGLDDDVRENYTRWVESAVSVDMPDGVPLVIPKRKGVIHPVRDAKEVEDDEQAKR